MAIVVRSALLDRHGFAHGFSTRVGGVSEGPFASLNLARNVGDDLAAVEENYARVAKAIGYDVSRLREATQVHGAEIVFAETSVDAETARAWKADALVCREAGTAVGVRTADCVPILVADPATGAVAAIHAGWRGVVAHVVTRAIAALGGDPSALVAAIGPHIRLASFEVSEDVAVQIAAASTADVVDFRVPRPHVDLARAVRAQLLAIGLEAANVDDVGGDTFAEAARFHSHRRDGERSGRQLSAIVAR
jgi:YfiH family protein